MPTAMSHPPDEHFATPMNVRPDKTPQCQRMPSSTSTGPPDDDNAQLRSIRREPTLGELWGGDASGMNAVLGAATSEVVVSQGSSITDRVAMLLASVDKAMMVDGFRRMNADENGIELRELHAFLAEIDESVTEADARSVISAGGPSGDGKVSLAELLKIKAREDGTSLDLSPDERSWPRRPSVQGRVPPLRMSPRASVPPSASVSSVWSPFGWNRPASSGRDAYEKSARTPGSDGQKSVGRSQRSAPPLPLVIERAAAEKAERAAAEKVAAEAALQY
jgi:hypothetical protein